MSREMTEVGKLKVGRFIVIDGEPCRIVSFSTFARGKNEHESAKINAIGLFDAQKRILVHPTSAKIEVPIIRRGNAKVLAIVSNNAQLMDLTTYETFGLPIHLNLRSDVREGVGVEYIQALGRRKIERADDSPPS